MDIDVRLAGRRPLEILTRTQQAAPLELSLNFREWLATMRASLDNGLYAWVAVATGVNPPQRAERIQYPICSSLREFHNQVKHLKVAVPTDILEKIEKARPYQSPHRPRSNLSYWIHELARTADRTVRRFVCVWLLHRPQGVVQHLLLEAHQARGDGGKLTQAIQDVVEACGGAEPELVPDLQRDRDRESVLLKHRGERR